MQTYDWQVIMSHPYNHKAGYGNRNRPRRMSIHTIASVVNRDPLEVLEEMEKSDLCLGYPCPDVGGAPIFYLKELRGIMTDTPTQNAFQLAKEWLVKYPITTTKGFQRHAGTKFAMSTPFDTEDSAYEKELNQKLVEFRQEKKSSTRRGV